MIREYDIPTYNQLEAMLMEYGECCLIGIPGVGKTRISMHFAEKHNLNALVITPRTEINNRWQYWGSKTDNGSISTITIQNFYTAYSMFVDGIDLYIFDECHCLGAKKWGKSYDKFKDLIDTSKCYILGLSATPNRYFDEGYAVNNIGETVFNNHIVYCMGREEAISLGLIGRSKYVCALYDVGELKREYSKKKMTEELRGRLDYAFKNQPQIRDILIKHAPQNSPKKGIVYVDRIDSIDDGIDIIRMAFPEEKIWSVHSKMSKSRCNQICKEFEESESGFIVNVDILSEGVHYDGVNIIVMLRKTFSPTKFTQQTGRANNTKESIIFDLAANNVSVADTLSRIEISKIEFVGLGNGAARESTISNQEIVADYASDILSILNDIEQYYWTPKEDEILRKYYPSEGSKVANRLSGRSEISCRRRARALCIEYASSKWTPEEDEILKTHYPSMGSDAFKFITSKTDGQCRYRLKVLGVEFDKRAIRWTQEEDEILKTHYPSIGSDVVKLLPNRDTESVMCRASKLNIRFSVFHKWTPEEDEILKTHYPSMGLDIDMPGISRDSIARRARKLGLNTTNTRKWTQEEDEILRKYYPSEGSKVAKRLPKRTEAVCIYRANKLNIACNRNWTPEEDEIIRKYYPSEGSKVANRLPGRSESSCHGRAATIRVKFNKNIGWTPEEVEILKTHYPSIGLDVVKLLPGRTEKSISAKVHKLGIRRDK